MSRSSASATAATNETLQYLSFGIDAAKVSGWGLALGTSVKDLLGSGVAKTAIERRDACIYARDWAADLDLPLLVVAESWPGRFPGQKQALGMGRAFGRWLENIELVLGAREDHILRIGMTSWRADLFPADLLRLAKEQQKEDRTGYKRLACAFADVADDNEAEAICITVWSQASFEGAEAAVKLVARLRRARKRV